MIAEVAQRMRSRLGDNAPKGPMGPEVGFSEADAAVAKRGSDRARQSLHLGTTQAYAQWTSLTRAHTKHDGDIEDLYDEYRQAAHSYIQRCRSLDQ